MTFHALLIIGSLAFATITGCSQNSDDDLTADSLVVDSVDVDTVTIPADTVTRIDTVVKPGDSVIVRRDTIRIRDTVRIRDTITIRNGDTSVRAGSRRGTGTSGRRR